MYGIIKLDRSHGVFHPQFIKEERMEIILEVLDAVKLPRSIIKRTPPQLSGGQWQRIVIAKVLMLKPELVICDEPVASLDVCLQRQIVELLCRFQSEQCFHLVV